VPFPFNNKIQNDFTIWLLVFLFVLFNPFSQISAASNVPVYFDFKPSQFFTNTNKSVTLTVLYDLGDISEDRFKLRPYSEKSSVKIKDSVDIDSNGLWTLMPVLANNVKLELGGNFIFTNLWLAILDTKTGKIYETPKHKIWNGDILIKYLEALNANLLK
jgi:hypothetical protein